MINSRLFNVRDIIVIGLMATIVHIMLGGIYRKIDSAFGGSSPSSDTGGQ